MLAACHVHSDWSYDGTFPLEALHDKFARAGYRALLITEHDRGFSRERLAQLRQRCSAISTAELLVTPGIEYSDAANQVHILVWGNVPFLGEGRPTKEILEKVKSHAGVAVLAHPARREAWRCVDPSWGELLLGVEVWNRKYDGWAPSPLAQELQERFGVVAFAGLDFHTQKQFFPLGMSMNIPSDITEEALLASMRARRLEPCLAGAQLDGHLVRYGLPILRAAEKARRGARAVSKKMKAHV